jgi:hypothetical protein
MPTVKQIVATLLIAITGTIAAGIAAFLNEIYLEISFDKLKDFKITDLSSWTALGTSVKFNAERASPEDFIAYWVDIDNNKRIVRRSRVSYQNFRGQSRIRGVITDEDDKTPYALTGFYNNNRAAFAHRGPISGVGIYILDFFQLDNLGINVYAGYAIIEDQVGAGASMIKLLRCPFVMTDEAAASSKITSIDIAKATFPMLNRDCTPFEMPADVVPAGTKR